MRSMFLLLLYKAVANGMRMTAITVVIRAVKKVVRSVKRRFRK